MSDYGGLTSFIWNIVLYVSQSVVGLLSMLDHEGFKLQRWSEIKNAVQNIQATIVALLADTLAYIKVHTLVFGSTFD